MMKTLHDPTSARTADGPRRRPSRDAAPVQHGAAHSHPSRNADVSSMDRALCAACLLDGLYARVLEEAPLEAGTPEHEAVVRIRRHLAGHADALRSLGAGQGPDCVHGRTPGESPLSTVARIDHLLGTALSLHAFAQRFASFPPPPRRTDVP